MINSLNVSCAEVSIVTAAKVEILAPVKWLGEAAQNVGANFRGKQIGFIGIRVNAKPLEGGLFQFW
jgi:hypothetical protein